MSMLPHTTERVAERSDRHEELLDGVEALFAEHGFRRLTLSDLAAELRCSRRALYELADTRHDLVALVVGRFLDRNFECGVAAMHGQVSARSRIEAFAGAVIGDSQRVSVAFADDIFRTSRTASLLADYDERCARLVHDLIIDGQRSGEFRVCHPSLAARGLMAAIARVQDSTVLADLELSYAEATRGTIDIFLDGLTRRTHDERRPPAGIRD